MKSKRLIYQDAKSHKFWEVATKGKEQTVRYGRVGQAGREQTKSFATAAEAEASAHKLERAKRAKGYSESPGKSPKTKKTKKATKKATKKRAASKSVEQTLGDIKTWLAGHDEEELGFFTERKPAKVAAIRAAEKALGFKLPPDYVDFLKVHNGTSADVLWGGLHRVEELAERRDWLMELCGDQDVDEEDIDARIKVVGFSEKWVPITTSARNRDHLCLDLDPDEGGTVGQVLLMASDDDDVEWMADSFGALLRRYYASLQGKDKDVKQRQR